MYTHHAHETHTQAFNYGENIRYNNVLLFTFLGIKIDLKVKSELQVRTSGFGCERSENPAEVVSLKPHSRETWRRRRVTEGQMVSLPAAEKFRVAVRNPAATL